MDNDSHSNTKNNRNTWAAQDHEDGTSDEDEDDTCPARKRKKMFINMDEEHNVQEVSPWKWKEKSPKALDRPEGWVATSKVSKLELVLQHHWLWCSFYSSVMSARPMEFCAYGASKCRNRIWNRHIRHVLGQGSTARSKVSLIMFLFHYLFAEAEHRSAFHLPSTGKGSWITEHCSRECWNHTKGPVPCNEWTHFGTGENVHFWPKGHFLLVESGQGVEGEEGRVQGLMAKIPPF